MKTTTITKGESIQHFHQRMQKERPIPMMSGLVSVTLKLLLVTKAFTGLMNPSTY